MKFIRINCNQFISEFNEKNIFLSEQIEFKKENSYFDLIGIVLHNMKKTVFQYEQNMFNKQKVIFIIL